MSLIDFFQKFSSITLTAAPVSTKALMCCPFNIALTVRSLGLLCGLHSANSSLSRAGEAGRKETGTGQTGFVAA